LSSVQGLVESGSHWGIDVSGVVGGVDSVVNVDVCFIIIESKWSLGSVGNVGVVHVMSGIVVGLVHVSGVVVGLVHVSGVVSVVV